MGENITGACLCGGVRFEITEPLGRAGYCHCTRCQRRSGTAASPNASLEPGSVRFIQGEELIKEWQPEDGFAKLFCGECGSALFSRPPGETDLAGVRLGVLDGDPGVRPDFHQFVNYAAPWEPIPDDGLVRYPERRTG
jgi:hypothetical protein